MKSRLVLGDHRRRRSRRAPSPTASSIELRRVRLGGDLLEEEPRETRVVAAPVVPVELRPALVGRQLVVERPRRRSAGCGGDSRGTPTLNATMPCDALRAFGRETDRPPDAVDAQPDEDGARRRRGVHHRLDVLDEPLVRVRSGVGRPVRAAVAAPVERDHAAGPAQVVDLAPSIGASARSAPRGAARASARPTPKTSYARRTPSADVANPDASGRRATPDSSASDRSAGAVSITSRSPGSGRSRGSAGSPSPGRDRCGAWPEPSSITRRAPRSLREPPSDLAGC